jgi:hypothetical protein
LVGNHEGAEDDDYTYYVYAPVSSGEDITLYPLGTAYDATDEEFQLDDAEVSPVKYDFILIELDPAKRGASGLEAESGTVTVSGEAGDKKVVYIYRDQVAAVTPTTNRPEGSTARTLPVSPGITLTITFLGDPAVGKDGGDLCSRINHQVNDPCRRWFA